MTYPGDEKPQQAIQHVIRTDRANIVRTVEKAIFSQPANASLVTYLCAKTEEVEEFMAAVQDATLSSIGRGYHLYEKVNWGNAAKGIAAGVVVMLPIAWVFSRIPWSLIVISALILSGISVGVMKKVAVIRQTVLALAIGAILGGSSYLTWQWFEYQEFRDGIRADVIQLRPDFSIEQQELAIDQTIEYESGSPGILGYIKLRMRGPTQWSYSWNPPSFLDFLDVINIIEVRGVGVLLIGALELGASIFIGIVMNDPRTDPPFCEADQTVMQPHRLFPVLPGDASRLTTALVHPANDRAARVLRQVNKLDSAVYLWLTVCPTCRQGILHWQYRLQNDRVNRKLPLGYLDQASAQTLMTAAKPAAENYSQREVNAFAGFMKSVLQEQATTEENGGNEAS